MRIIKSFLKLFLCVLMFTACTSDGAMGPEGPSLSGDLVGFAYMYNLTGARLSDNSGIIVTAYPDTLSSSKKKYIDTTNVDGRFQLPELSTGTYTITFSKTGYGTRKVPGFQFIGGGQVSFGSTNISALPTFNVTNLAATATATTITFSGTLTGTLPASYRYVRLFIGTSTSISSLPKDYVVTTTVSTSSTYTTFSSSINISSLASYGILTGQQLYIVAYAESYNSTSYLDLATGRYFYSSINPVPSNVVSVVAP